MEKGEKITLVCFCLLLKRERKKCLTLAAYFLRLETPGLPACYPLIYLRVDEFTNIYYYLTTPNSMKHKLRGPKW